MYKVNYDRSKNRIYGLLEGYMKIEEAQKYTAELKKAVDMASGGFTVLFDVINLMVLPREVSDEIATGKEYAVAKGLKKSALVMSSAILKLQVDRVFKKIGESEERYFDSISSAEEFLNS